MTTQIEDVVRYAGEDWTLYEKTSCVFDFDALGIKVGYASTACWRGFQLFYELRGTTLLLGEIWAHAIPIPKKVLGVSPERLSKAAGLNAVFRPLNQALNYSGGIILTRDLLDYPVMRSEIYEFGRVTELLFDGGNLVDIIDRTQAVADVRCAMHQREKDANELGKNWLDVGPDALADATRETFFWPYYEPRYTRYLELREWARTYEVSDQADTDRDHE
ncbi:MAG: hypothetical protein HOW73_29440 [Polyangiaceae bacterium]|nr:hypothetical protein [Polyangiaceae bacterium]